MKEVKKCSISGVAFTMDTDAYQELEAYLESLKKTYKETPDGAEIVADIEARIAELILSAQDSTRVVEKPLILNIIRQMGTAEDISEEEPGRSPEEPRIPRRLYRDTENAKLGGVCAGIGKYFDVDPVWIRLAMFLPILLTVFQWIPFMRWTGPMMGNLFGIFVICYIIMWFAVPAPRTARQKLEMNGEKITAQSIRESTEASASCDPDAKAKPIIGGASISIPFFPLGMTLWVPALGILIVLILVILLIYVLMCLIASRKPGGKTILVIFLLWLAGIIACTCIAIRENVGDRIRTRHSVIERMLNSEIIIDNDTTTVERLLEEYDSQNVIEDGRKTLHISVPNQSIDITIDREKAGLEVKANGKRVKVQTGDDKTESAKPDSVRQPDAGRVPAEQTE